MNKRLYVGNLSYNVTAEELQGLFAEVGEVTSSTVITDRRTDRSRGYGFVEMATEELAEQAIEALNGREVDGRMIKVAEARPPRQDRERRRRRDTWY